MTSSSYLNDLISFRASILSRHLQQSPSSSTSLSLQSSICSQVSSPELSEKFEFDPREMRKLMDHNVEDRDCLFALIIQSEVFCPRNRGGKVFVSPDYNQAFEQQREITRKRIFYLRDQGVFEGWLTKRGVEAEMRKFALFEVICMYDHALTVLLVVHFYLMGGAIQFLGTKRHQEKWLKDTEDVRVRGCFAMTELGHGSNVRGVEIVTTYDKNTGEFVINTPSESAQKYWIGGAVTHATHTIVFSQLHINGKNEGVHAFIAQIKHADGSTYPNVRTAECGHKIGLNGVDNGRIWFDNARVPRENLLNSVADVSADGQYLSAIKNPDQRFAAFLSPLTAARINIAATAIYSSKVGLAIAIRYSLTRRAFSVSPNEPEVLLLDYPSHQQRLLPLLAKTYAMTFAANYLKRIYAKGTEASKTIHIFSSAFKATFTWHNMRTLQECREACGGQGMKTENRVGQLKSEHDVQTTFEGDNNVLMQQVSKALFGEYIAAQQGKKPFKGLGLEHMNDPSPIIRTQLTTSIVRSAKFQKSIFCLREGDLLSRFADEVSHRQSQGESNKYAFIRSYQLGEDLARAFSQKAILQTFVETETNLSDGPLMNVVGLLRSLYALISMEEDGAFLRYRYLSPENAVFVRKELTNLCSELRPHASALVSSFGIPDAFLSPLAFDWVAANSWSSSQL